MHHVVDLVVAVFGLLLVASVSAVVLKKARLPYTVGLVLVGLGLGQLVERVEPLEVFFKVELSPEIILFVFLPTLIFESAFNLDSRLLSKNLAPVLTLAAPGLLFSTAIVGGLTALLTPLPWGPALLFGALISATDPVAVVALFKELGAPKRLAILVEGESLFNDATAIVLFQIILAAVTGGAVGAAMIGQGLIDFLTVFLGGLLIGGLVGYLMIRSIAVAEDDPLVEVALSTVVAYAAFIAADHYLHVSGVMATVGAGAVVGTMGSTRFSRHVRDYLHQFWEYAGFVANSLIFLLVGLSVELKAVSELLGPIGWVILAVLIARAAVVFGLTPLAGRMPGAEPVGWRYQCVMFWGGLRGAVALALALSLASDFPYRDQIVTLSVGIVLFTLLSGGLTMAPLIQWLGLNLPSLVERLGRAQARVAAKEEALARITRLSTLGHFSDTRTRRLVREYKREEKAAREELTQLRKSSGERELKAALWGELLTVERRVYRGMFDRGFISEPVLHELELSVDLQNDQLRRGRPPADAGAVMPLEMRVAALFFGAFERVFPKSRLSQRHRLQALAARYEHYTAVHEASRECLDALGRLAELAGAGSRLKDELEAIYRTRQDDAMAHIDSIAEHFPEYAASVQRRTARRIALDGEADAIEALARVGAIPAPSAREARRAVEKAQHRLMRQPIEALEPHPEELLARVPMFKGLNRSDFQAVAGKLTALTVLPGERLVVQGEKGSDLFLIARGVVAVLAARKDGLVRRIASLHPGDFFGEMALITGRPRNATVEAVTECQLYRLAKADVELLCRTCPGIDKALEETASSRGVSNRSPG